MRLLYPLGSSDRKPIGGRGIRFARRLRPRTRPDLSDSGVFHSRGHLRLCLPGVGSEILRTPGQKGPVVLGGFRIRRHTGRLFLHCAAPFRGDLHSWSGDRACDGVSVFRTRDQRPCRNAHRPDPRLAARVGPGRGGRPVRGADRAGHGRRVPKRRHGTRGRRDLFARRGRKGTDAFAGRPLHGCHGPHFDLCGLRQTGGKRVEFVDNDLSSQVVRYRRALDLARLDDQVLVHEGGDRELGGVFVGVHEADISPSWPEACSWRDFCSGGRGILR